MALLTQIGIIGSRVLTRNVFILRRIRLSGTRLLCYQHIRSKPKQASKRQNYRRLHFEFRGRPKAPRFLDQAPEDFVSGLAAAELEGTRFTAAHWEAAATTNRHSLYSRQMYRYRRM